MTSTKAMQESFKSSASLELEVSKLKKENKALNTTVSQLLKEVDRLRDNDKFVPEIITTPEQELLETQILKLNTISRTRDLNLEEVKKLDLLIKNKRLLQKKSTSNNEIILPERLSDDELMRIAESVENEDEGSEQESSSEDLMEKRPVKV